MQYSAWQSGTPVASPAYLDANVLVGAVVRGHPLYRITAQLTGELLASGVQILVSVLTVEESFWAMARLSFYELTGQRVTAGTHFSESVYRRHLSRIFQEHGARMDAVTRALRDWSDAGITVEVVPKTKTAFLSASAATPKYMRQFGLTPADAAHLAIAEAHANSFVTADRKFRTVAGQASADGLVIVALRP
jgi:predicted nucleic acid-binding protein